MQKNDIFYGVVTLWLNSKSKAKIKASLNLGRSNKKKKTTKIN